MADRTVSVRLRAITDQYQRGMRDAERSSRDFSARLEGMEQTGSMMTRRVTAPLVGVGSAAVAVGSQFESAMSTVEAVSGQAGSQLEAMESQAREMGATTQFSATEAADALGFLSMAGFEADEAMEALPHTLDLAAAAGMDLASAADLASNVLQQFALDVDETQRVADVLAEASRNANTSVEQLGQAMQMAGPIANAAGLDIEETAAAMGAMGDAGIQASQAGTSLRQAMTQLTRDSGPAADTLNELGIEAREADGSLRPIPDIIDDLGAAGAEVGDLMEIFGQRAGPAMASLIEQGGDALRDLEGDIRDSGGAAAEMADTQMDNLQGSLRELRSAASEAGIALFESGIGEALEGAADGARNAFTWFSELEPETQQLIVSIGGVAAATGPTIRVLARLARTARNATIAMGLLNPKMLAISAAAGLLAGAYVSLHGDTVDVEEAHWEFVAALRETEGQLDQTSEAAVRKRLEDEGLIDAAETLGVESRTLVDAVMGEADAHRQVMDAIEAHKSGNENWAISNNDAANAAGELVVGLEELEGAFEDARREAIADELEEMGVSLADLDHGLRETVVGAEDLDAALDALPPHMRPVEDASDDTADGLRDVEAAAEDAAASVDTFAQALDELYGEARDLEEAHRDLLDELAALEDQFDDTTGTLDIHSEAGRENRESLQRAAEAVGEHASAVYDSTGDIREARSAADEHYDSLLDQAEAAGISRDAVADYLEELGLTPEEIETAIRLEADDAEESLQRITQRISELPDSHTVRVRTSGAGIDTSGGGGGGGGGGQESTSAEVRHTGGIAGSGGVPTRSVLPLEPLASNEVPTILERGEVVLSRDAVQRGASTDILQSAPITHVNVQPAPAAGGELAGELRRLRQQLGQAMSFDVDGDELARVTDKQRQRRAARSLAVQTR